MRLYAFDILSPAWEETRDWFSDHDLLKRWTKLALILLLMGAGFSVNLDYRQQIPRDDVGALFEGLTSDLMSLLTLENTMLWFSVFIIIQGVLIFLRSVLSFMYIDILIKKDEEFIPCFKGFIDKGFSLWTFMFPVTLITRGVGLIFLVSLSMFALTFFLSVSDTPIEEVITQIQDVAPPFIQSLLTPLLRNNTTLPVLFLSSLLLLILLSIIEYLVNSITVPLMYFKKIYIINAIQQSLRLVSGNLLQIIVYAVTVVILSIIAAIPLLILGFIFGIPALIISVALGMFLIPAIEKQPILLVIAVPITLVLDLGINYLATFMITPIAIYFKFFNLLFVQKMDPGIVLRPGKTNNVLEESINPQS